VTNPEYRRQSENALIQAVNDWLAETDLTGLPEPAEPVHLPLPNTPITVVRPVRLPFELDALVKALAEARGVSMSSLIHDWIAAGCTPPATYRH